MATDPPSSSGAAPPGGRARRPPPTIDLTATEVASAPAAAVSKPAVPTDDQPATAPHHASERGFRQPPPEPESRASSAPPDESSGATARRSSIAWLPPGIPWRSIGAGAAAGAIAALLALGIANLVTGRDRGASVLERRVALLEQQLRDAAARPLLAGVEPRVVEELTAGLARLEAAVAAPRPSPTDPALANRISAIEGQVKALAETVGIIGRRGDEAVATAREARQRAEATAAALAEVAQKLPGRAAIERSEFDTLAARVAELAKRPQGGNGDRSSRLAVAAAALNDAVARGDPFAAELAAVKPLVAEPARLAPLEPFAATGVPAATGMARELSALAPALLQAAGSPSRDGGFLERLQASAEKLVRVRPLDEVAGADPAAIVARIEAKAARADLAGALAELALLPADARAPAATWIRKAEARTAALEASRRLASDALSGLSK